MSVHGKNILITGASKGIGLACVKHFEKENNIILQIGKSFGHLSQSTLFEEVYSIFGLELCTQDPHVNNVVQQ